ncbi:unnamed protein product [Caenorhabditis brenneri]
MFFAAVCFYGSINSDQSRFDCIVPKDFPTNWEHEVWSSCYHSTLYIIPEHSTSRSIYNERGVLNFKSINYYSDLLMLACVGAFLCLIPRVLWKLALCGSPVKLESYLKELEKVVASPLDQRKKGIAQLCDRVMDGTETRQLPISILRSSVFSVPRPGIVFHDILKKTLYVCNFAAQLFVSYSVFDHGLGPAWPVKYLSNLVYGVDNNEVFPTTAFCEYNIFLLHNMGSKRVLQCELPLNRLAKIALVLHWFWMSLFGAIAVFDLLGAIVSRFNNKQLLEDILYLNRAMDKDDQTTRILVNRFKKTIPQEFIFVLNYMNNTNILVARESAYYLYEKWLATQSDDNRMYYTAPASQSHHQPITLKSVHIVQMNNMRMQQQVQSRFPTATIVNQIEMMP